jgi:hypothetical protein
VDTDLLTLLRAVREHAGPEIVDADGLWPVS